MQDLKFTVIGEQGCGKTQFIFDAVGAEYRECDRFGKKIEYGVDAAFIKSDNLPNTMLFDIPSNLYLNTVVSNDKTVKSFVALSDVVLFMLSAKTIVALEEDRQVSGVQLRGKVSALLRKFVSNFKSDAYLYCVIGKVDEVGADYDESKLKIFFQNFLNSCVADCAKEAKFEPLRYFNYSARSDDSAKLAEKIVKTVQYDVITAEKIIDEFEDKFCDHNPMSKQQKSAYIDFFRDQLRALIRKGEVGELISLYDALNESLTRASYSSAVMPLGLVSIERNWFRSARYGKTNTFKSIADMLAKEIVLLELNNVLNTAGSLFSFPDVLSDEVNAQQEKVKAIVKTYNGRSLFGRFFATPAQNVLRQKLSGNENAAQLAQHFGLTGVASAA